MAETLAITTSSMSVGWNLANTTSYSVSSSNASTFTFSQSFTNGTGAGKAQKIFIDQVSISGSSTQSYDLSGSLTNPLGAAVVMTNVKGLYVEHATSTATGKCIVRGNFMGANSLVQPIKVVATFDGSTDGINLYPMGCLYLTTGSTTAAGYTVTNSSADTITIANADAAAVTVRILVFGE